MVIFCLFVTSKYHIRFNEERKFPEKLDEENTKSKDIPEFFLDREKESEEKK